MKRERILPLVLAVIMLLSLLASPLYAGAATTTGTGNNNSNSGQNNSSTNSQLQGMGFDPTQPPRLDPDGNQIDTNTQNPFGAPSKTFVSSMSVATAGINGASFELHDDTMSTWALQGNSFMTENSTRVYNSAGTAYDWRTLPKVMTAANLNETTVYQQVLTAVLVPDPNGTTYGLQLVIEDYNAGGKPNNYIIPLKMDGITIPGLTRAAYPSDFVEWQYGNPAPRSFQAQDYKSHLQMVACRGRVAILVNQTLYDFALNYSKASGYTVTQKRSVTFNSNNSLAPIAAGDTPVIDLKAGDVNNDGLQDLAVTVSSAQGTKGTNLLLYKWEQDQSTSFSQPMYALGPNSISVPVSGSGNSTGDINFNDIGKSLANAGPGLFLVGMKQAAVAVGNVTGRGPAVLVSGYTGKNVFTFMYVTYNPQTGKFTASPQIPVTGNSMPGLDNDPNPKYNVVPDLACVSFGAPSPGLPQYVFYDGWIFQYDQNARNFALIFHDSQDYCSWGNGKNEFCDMIFFDTAAGNLSHAASNQPGAEQLAVLTGNSYLGDRVNVRWYSMNNGQIKLTKGGDIPAFQYPALSGAVVKGTFKSLKYVSYAFSMSEPKVVTVLGASPYYQELQSTYAGWGNQATTFGTSTSKENGTGNSVNTSVGVTAGVDIETDVGFIFSTRLSEVEFTVNATAEFSWEWSKSTSFSTSQSFSAIDKDMAVLTCTPCDLYTYQVSDPGQPDDGSYVVLSVPYKPQLSMMNLDDYNDTVDAMNQAAGKTVTNRVPSSVLNHTAGDPRTYPSDPNNFSGIVPGTVVVPEAGFTGVGSGSGLAEESITQEATSSKSFEAGVDVTLELTVIFGIVEAGVNAGVGYHHTATSSVGSGTEISGSVLNLPSDKSGKYNQYNFNWELVGYKAYLTPDKSDQCYVVNYLVQMNGNTPPPAPSNLQLISYTTTVAGASATIAWDSGMNVNKYLIYRSTSQNFDTTEPYATVYPQAGANNQPKPPIFVDNNLVKGQQYYYEVVAEKEPGVDSAPSDPLAVPELITGFAIKSQPGLDYSVGDTLDLSSLVITATLADNSTTDLTFYDLLQRGMNFSIPDGTVLSLKNNGVPIAITDPVTSLRAVTAPLRVTQVALSSLVITTSFTVGSTDHATSLAPNKALTAHISVTNNQSTPQAVIAVVALFDPDGAMTNVAYSSQTIAAGATVKFDEGGFTLPSPITGYVARAFVLEGTQFSTSSLRPLSSIAQISS